MALTILGLCLSAQSPASLPARVADYSAFLSAQELFDEGDFGKAIDALKPVWTFQPISPLVGRSAILAAKAYEQLNQPADALQVLRDYRERIPLPEGLLLLGRNAESASDTAGAAAYYQGVFYSYPLSKEAVEADMALIRLKAILGDNFPPVLPQVRIERADRLARSGQGVRARREYASMTLDFAGLERDLARVRAVSDSYSALAGLQVAAAEADAERLYLMHSAARRAKLDSTAISAIEEITRKYPKSRWRMQALISQGNAYLIKNEPAAYQPLYKACYSDFRGEPEAATCHWKLVWASYMRREGSAMLEEHLRTYPDSEKTSAALYFMKRRAELVSRFPLSYYSTLVPKQSAPVIKKTQLPDFQPSASMQLRLDRSRVLESMGFPEWAEFELQWAADNESNSFPAAMALAESAARRGAHDVSLRYIKKYAPGYLSIPLEAAPERFWKLAFPLPYRAALESACRIRGLDPYLVAALIRQESEFNPQAISSAKAYGLTQVLPSTGRQISRRAGVTGFTTSMLLQPEPNIKIGTYYLRTLLDQHGGDWEKTLASYNAGKSRADLWSSWAEYREPAEFVESVPFTETRNYIQIVLRNAEVYRRLYSGANGR